MKLRLALLCLMLLPGLATAASLADCRAIAADDLRLACYDRIADGTPAVGGKADLSDVTAPPAVTPALASTLLGRAWELEPETRGHILRIRPYQPVYLLPAFHTDHPNRQPSSPSAGHGVAEPIDLSNTEAKLQISLKTKVMEDIFGNNGDLWFGYTQSSRWQVYNGGLSRPFRETNHEPEAMLVWRTDYDFLGWRGRFLNLSLNHQSNGRSLPLSRSWNRLMLSAALERDNWTMTLRPWWRLPESRSKDDNPDIADYVGRADLLLVRRTDNHQFSVLLRHTLRSGEASRGAVQLDYAFPIAGELRGHLQWFSGYGESLIDYNHRANYFGLGVSLLEWY